MSSDQNTTPAKKQPTDKDILFLYHVLKNQSGDVKIDFAAVAEGMGLKNASTASVRYGQIKKKLGWANLGGPNAGSPASTPGSAVKTPGRKRGPNKVSGVGKRTHHEASDDEEDVSDMYETPMKKVKTREPSVDSIEDDDERAEYDQIVSRKTFKEKLFGYSDVKDNDSAKSDMEKDELDGDDA